MNNEKELSELMVAAYTHQKNAQYSLAIQAWNALARQNDADNDLKANAHLNLGYLHQQQGNDDLAIESMAQAIESNPNSAQAYFCLAYLAQEKEEFTQAIDYFKSALALDNND